MKCPECGTELQSGEIFCPVCGLSVPENEENNTTNTDAVPTINVQEETPAYTAPVSSAAVVSKKPGSKKLFPTVLAAVALIAVTLCLIFVLKGGFKNGKYVCNSFAAFGIDMYIEVDGDDFAMVSTYGESTERQNGTIKFKGDKVTLTIEGVPLECTYDKKTKTITIGEDGIYLEFVKE